MCTILIKPLRTRTMSINYITMTLKFQPWRFFFCVNFFFISFFFFYFSQNNALFISEQNLFNSTLITCHIFVKFTRSIDISSLGFTGYIRTPYFRPSWGWAVVWIQKSKIVRWAKNPLDLFGYMLANSKFFYKS